MIDKPKPDTKKGALGEALHGLASELGVAQPQNVEEVQKGQGRPASSTGAQTTDSGATEP